VGAFSGWPPSAIDFYRELESENTRAWWLDHKATYDADVRAPFDALSELVADEFGPLHARITDTWRSAAPLNEWLAVHVGPTTAPPDSRW
jgi:uncharacterized protein (DUF2461 family)